MRWLLGFYPITQSATAPIVRFDAMSRLLFCIMIGHLKLDDRLSVLRAEDRFRNWRSLDDERLCIICNRKFSGRQVEIRRLGNRKYELRCPTEGCKSGTHLWIYPATPLVSHVVASNWWRPLGKNSNAARLRPRCGQRVVMYD